MEKTKPLLSVGLIFKNEIRCLERCLSSFSALKRAVPCEIVAADTGSTDGSHEVAERYADVLIDFPWINDFAAARNAVMDRASGTWFLTVDADEWLDKDISKLVEFLKSPLQWKKFIACSVTFRNYSTSNLKGSYSDFTAVRLIRMSSGMRYKGAIHERLDGDMGVVCQLDVLFHHDGYVGFSSSKGDAKRERNMGLLREEFEKNPDDLLLCLQCIESSQGEEQEEFLRLAIEGVREKKEHWNHVGPAVFRYAAILGFTAGKADWWERADEGEELFPNSYFTRIDVGYFRVNAATTEGKYERAIRYGESYLAALKKYREDHSGEVDLSYSSLHQVSDDDERYVQVKLADAYFETENYKKAKAMLSGINYEKAKPGEVLQGVATMMNVHSKKKEDLRLALSSLWSQIDRREDAEACKQAVVNAVLPLFSSEKQKQMPQIDHRYACGMFTILEGECVLGDAAALLTETKSKRLNSILARQKDLKELPASALLCALSRGAAFPLPGKPMNMEEMDAFAIHLMQEPEDFLAMASTVEPGADAQSLCWAKTVAMAGVKLCDWTGGGHALGLARAFAGVERKFLPLCYAPDALTDEYRFLLPPMHRFGWFCSRAFGALDRGDAADCVRLLRMGLETCPEMGKMVGFLLDNLPELQARPDPSEELRQISGRIRDMLALYDPDDPAVEAIKHSEIYQRVAHLIEGIEAPVTGGLAQ